MARSKYVKGLDKLESRLSEPDWIEKPAGSLLRKWRDDVRAYVVEHVPVWRGESKAEFESEQDTAKFPLWARVFSNSPQARWMEYGTGLLSDDPKSAHRRYFPNILGITPWSLDHGLVPYLVAKGIYDRGGIAPRHYFRDAEAHADANLNRYLGAFAREIESAA